MSTSYKIRSLSSVVSRFKSPATPPGCHKDPDSSISSGPKRDTEIYDKRGLLLKSVLDFFIRPHNFYKMWEYLEKYEVCTLEWFVTNYAKNFGTRYIIRRPGTPDVEFDVFDQYRAQLQPWGKELFDPYRRGERFTVTGANNQAIETTLAQLSFFQWAIRNLVLDYVIKHYDEIHQDLTTRGRAKGSRPGRKRELSLLAYRQFQVMFPGATKVATLNHSEVSLSEVTWTDPSDTKSGSPQME